MQPSVRPLPDCLRETERLASDADWNGDSDLARKLETVAHRLREQIVMVTGDDWASAGARLRDLRKPKFGGYQVDRRALGNGAFEYRLLINREDAA